MVLETLLALLGSGSGGGWSCDNDAIARALARVPAGLPDSLPAGRAQGTSHLEKSRDSKGFWDAGGATDPSSSAEN